MIFKRYMVLRNGKVKSYKTLTVLLVDEEKPIEKVLKHGDEIPKNAYVFDLKDHTNCIVETTDDISEIRTAKWITTVDGTFSPIYKGGKIVGYDKVKE